VYVFLQPPAIEQLQQQSERRKIKVSLEHLESHGDELLCRSCVMKFSKQLDYDLHLQSEEHEQVCRFFSTRTTLSVLMIPCLGTSCIVFSLLWIWINEWYVGSVFKLKTAVYQLMLIWINAIISMKAKHWYESMFSEKIKKISNVLIGISQYCILAFISRSLNVDLSAFLLNARPKNN